MNSKRAAGTEGFTLIEVLVALSVVAVSLSAIGSLDRRDGARRALGQRPSRAGRDRALDHDRIAGSRRARARNHVRRGRGPPLARRRAAVLRRLRRSAEDRLGSADRGGAGAVAVRSDPAGQHRAPAPGAIAMRTRARRRRRIAGFTLVEALLATALMGVILASIGTVTAQWLPNWNRGFQRVQRVELLALGLERIVADIAAAEFVTAGANVRQPVFDGSELVGHVPAHRARAEHAARSRAGPHPGDRQREGADDGAPARALHADGPRRHRGAGAAGRPRGAGARALSHHLLLRGPGQGVAQRVARRSAASQGGARAAARRHDRPHARGLDRDVRPCRNAERLRARRGDRGLPQSPRATAQQPSG